MIPIYAYIEYYFIFRIIKLLYLLWCKQNNNIILSFRKTPNNVEKYIEFIGNCKKNKIMIQNVKKIEDLLKLENIDKDDSLKMTYINIHSIL